MNTCTRGRSKERQPFYRWSSFARVITDLSCIFNMPVISHDIRVRFQIPEETLMHRQPYA